MGGLFDALTVGANGLQTQQLGAQVSGANIANSNAAGFHRNDVRVRSGMPYNSAQTAQAVRSGNPFFDAHVQTQTGAFAFAGTRQVQLQALQSSVADMASTGIGGALNEFMASLTNFSARPEDVSIRSEVLGRMGTLVGRINSAATTLNAAQTDADGQVRATVSQANDAIEAIASLNQRIVTSEASGRTASDLRDQRDAAVAQLASLTGAKVMVDPRNGSYNVAIGNDLIVVQGENANLLTTTADAVTGLQQVGVAGTTLGDITARLSGGSLGALLQVRDSDIPQNIAALDTFAADLTAALNTTHAAGYGLDGGTGRNLLTPHATAGAALALSVDAAVAGNPNALAASATAAGVPGDATVAASLAALATQEVASANSRTFAGALADMVGDVGRAVAGANAEYAQNSANLTGAKNLAESDSGVSTEEQLMLLSRYNNGFQAAIRFISTVDSMMATLMQM